MVTIGVSFEGFPHLPLKTLDDGHVVPDASVEEINERHRECLRNQIDAAKTAEELGYDYVVHSEHHGSLLWSVSPNPVLTQTAIARETEDVRLLQMANILPWHEPVRLAEQLSMLDVLSDGRVEVGVGSGFADLAAETMGQYWGGTPANQVKNDRSFEEKFEILQEAWTDQFVSYDGEFHTVPPSYSELEKTQERLYFDDDACEYEPETYLSEDGRSTTLESLPVVPQPEQSPHPQLWKPALSPSGAAWAARRGMNVCTHVFDVAGTRELIDAYYDAADDAGWPDRKPKHDGDRFDRGWDEQRARGVGIILPVLDTEVADEAALERWKRTFEYSQSRKAAIDDGEQDEQFSPDVDALLEENAVPITGGPEDVADGVARLLDAWELDDACIVVDPNWIGLTHEERIEQLESFAERIRPRLDRTLTPAT